MSEPKKKLGCFSKIALVIIAVVLFFYIKNNFFSGRDGKSFTKVIEKFTEQAKTQELIEKKANDPNFESKEIKGAPFNLDKTMRILYSIDIAHKQFENYEQMFAFLMAQDIEGVPAEVLKSRAQLFRINKKIFEVQRDLDGERGLYKLVHNTLSSMVAAGDFQIGMTGFDMKFGGEDARRMLKEQEKKLEKEDLLVEELDQHKGELLEAMLSYSAVYHKYAKQWDQLCMLRDRAYIAAHEGQWNEAISNAEKAIKQAPEETEAHLVLAYSLIQKSKGFKESSDLDKAHALIDDYIKKHPKESAPGLLLRGIIKKQRGQIREAQTDFQQSAAYFPRQKDALTDMLNPYKMRPFLRATREGKFVLELYQASMLGAGYYSPDFHLAKINYQNGNKKDGRLKVLDHFYRRRNQQLWDEVLTDLDFCADYLGTDYRQIFPEDGFINLELDKKMLSSAHNVRVHNNSDKTLHNASLILCLKLTDMHPEDYITVKVGETLPELKAHSPIDFGSLKVKHEFLGQIKTNNDIVSYRAIMISNEGVIWVDDENFHHAEIVRLKQELSKEEINQKLSLDWLREPVNVQDVLKKANIEDKLSFGKDGFTVTLPRELAILQPVFELGFEGKKHSPTKRVLRDDVIELVFEDIVDLEDSDKKEGIKVLAKSLFKNFSFEWDQSSPQDAEKRQYKVKEVEAK